LFTRESWLAHVALREGEYVRAEHYASESIAGLREIGDRTLGA
jgi:hypothetical protein